MSAEFYIRNRKKIFVINDDWTHGALVNAEPRLFHKSYYLGLSNQYRLNPFLRLNHTQSDETPKKISSTYIKELKEYNELRDAGLRLAQIIADEKQCKIKDVFEEIGYSMKD